jgi:hypothetical protein
MRFKIYSPGHTLFAATHLKQQLERLGHNANVVDSIDTTSKDIFILYNASWVQVLPNKYVVYQTEISTSHWFNPRYFKIIRNALSVWDYSESNIKKYHSFNNNIHIVSPGVAKQYRCKKEIEVTFYGWIEGSARRKKIIETVNRGIKVNVITNVLGRDMWNILRRTKVVLNIHYYENSPLELFRVHEALSFGCHVVSETPSIDRYKEFVTFAAPGNGIVEKLIECTKKEFNFDLSPLDNTEEIKQALQTL